MTKQQLYRYYAYGKWCESPLLSYALEISEEMALHYSQSTDIFLDGKWLCTVRAGTASVCATQWAMDMCKGAGCASLSKYADLEWAYAEQELKDQQAAYYQWQ